MRLTSGWTPDLEVDDSIEQNWDENALSLNVVILPWHLQSRSIRLQVCASDRIMTHLVKQLLIRRFRRSEVGGKGKVKFASILSHRFVVAASWANERSRHILIDIHSQQSNKAQDGKNVFVFRRKLVEALKRVRYLRGEEGWGILLHPSLGRSLLIMKYQAIVSFSLSTIVGAFCLGCVRLLKFKVLCSDSIS